MGWDQNLPGLPGLRTSFDVPLYVHRVLFAFAIHAQRLREHCLAFPQRLFGLR